MTAFAQQTSRGGTFDQFRASVDAPQDARGPALNPMEQQREQTGRVQAWLNSNSWRELPLRDQMWLFDHLRGPDLIDKWEFSVRWTGMLRVPANGSYTFTQYQMSGAEGFMRLWVDGSIVLDSFPSEDQGAVLAPDNWEAEEAARFRSSPVALTAGQAVEFRLDYVQKPMPVCPGLMPLSNFPAAILQWESEALEQQVIPEAAFTTPAASVFRGQTGLQAEYFSDLGFTRRAALRRDAAIDFFWDVGTVVTDNRDMQEEIVVANIARLSSPGFFATLREDEAEVFVTQQLPSLLRSMSATQRVAVMLSLKEQPDLLKHVSFAQMAAALRWLSLNASNDAAISLLAQWSELTPQPQTVPGFFPGRVGGGFLSLNIEPYFRLSRLFAQGDVEENMNALAEHLTKADGSCNLTILYILCCVCRMTGNAAFVLPLVTEPTQDNNLVGDARMTWYLAQAFASETLFGHDFQPGRGTEHVREALEAAESPEARFWAYRELLARLLTADRQGEARTTAESMREEFSDAEKHAVIDTWLQRGEEISAHYQRLREDQVPDRQAFIDEITRRAETAERRGNRRSAGRYQRIVTDHNVEVERREAERARQ
jgi:hypothetical protein